MYDDVKSLGFDKIARHSADAWARRPYRRRFKLLKELSGAKIYAYEDEAEILKDPERTCQDGWERQYGFEADVYFT